jgi:hypothetical protein
MSAPNDGPGDLPLAGGRFAERTKAMTTLILKRASASRPSGEWNDDDFDVLADGVVVGRIMRTAAAPRGMMPGAVYSRRQLFANAAIAASRVAS